MENLFETMTPLLVHYFMSFHTSVAKVWGKYHLEDYRELEPKNKSVDQGAAFSKCPFFKFIISSVFFFFAEFIM